MTGRKSERIGLRIEPFLRKALDSLAKKEHRSLSNYVETVLSKHALNTKSRPARSSRIEGAMEQPGLVDEIRQHFRHGLGIDAPKTVAEHKRRHPTTKGT